MDANKILKPNVLKTTDAGADKVIKKNFYLNRNFTFYLKVSEISVFAKL